MTVKNKSLLSRLSILLVISILISLVICHLMIPQFLGEEKTLSAVTLALVCGFVILSGSFYVFIIRYFIKSMTGFKNILNKMGTYLFISDSETYEIKFMNDAMKEHYGLDDHVIGRRCWEALQTGLTKPCSFCPIQKLNDSEALVWEERNSLTGRYYKNTSSIASWGYVKRAYIQHSVDIHELKAAETILKKRLQQEELLSAISQSFISAENLGVLINRSLLKIGGFMKVSKVVIARLNRETSMLEYEYEWYNEEQGIPKLAKRSYLFSPGGVFHDTFITKDEPYLFCNDVEVIPKIAQFFQPLGIKSFISVPIVIQNNFWGVLVIDECLSVRLWDESDIQFVQLIANALAGIIMRGIAEQQFFRMAAIVNGTPQYVSYFVPSGDFKYINQGVSNLSGYTSEELMQYGMDLLFDDETRSFLHEIFIPTVLERGSHETEIPLIRKDGKRRILSFSAFTLGHKEDGLGGIGTDITEIRELETALITAKERAEQSSLAKSNFLSRMSHEMRTPMNAIIGMTTIAQTSQDQEKLEYCLGKINEASVHLLGVINDILDMSKIEAGKFELSCSEFDFEKMLLRVTGVMNFRITEKRQDFVVRLDQTIPRLIITDEHLLAQVFTNLLSNAIKFTPEEGVITLSVDEIACTENLHTLRCSVSDTGIGISQEQQKRLFSLFEQADNSIARKFGGTGLGLAISKSIVKLMGGEIWVTSELGKGAAFIFEITVEGGKISEAAVCIEEDSAGPKPPSGPAAPQKTAISQESNCFTGRCILLAEDVEINREIVLALLEHTGISIDSAENGNQVITMFQADPSKYDLILMDIHMPEMDGFEAARHIRALNTETARRIPIVAMTANVFREDIEHCLAAGMNDHLGKPIDMEELLKKLTYYLGN